MFAAFGAVGVRLWRVRWFRLSIVFGAVRAWCWRVRWFRLSAVFVAGCGSCLVLFFFASSQLVLAWCWLCSFALCFGLVRVRWSRIVYFCSVPRVGRPMPKLGSLRCKLAAFKYRSADTIRAKRPAPRRYGAGPGSAVRRFRCWPTSGPGAAVAKMGRVRC